MNERPTPAEEMEEQEYALLKRDRREDAEQRKAAAEADARASTVQEVGQTESIRPKVALHTDRLSEQHEPTPADEMEAEEQELVIENSVDDVLTYAQKPLSDAEIEAQALTRPDEIKPKPEA
ncbi:MAG: hypothetical protein Q4C79_05055 [Neisseria sp.]|uniref:hypothetical protein n=1 Tax=Neisseria sp. TaxID=192066 RepID=UPI0026DCA952|nr:hypothetical protein [Neisseria sp.]MDO4248318.1 hypothetical protein [Neisseria sp.]